MKHFIILFFVVAQNIAYCQSYNLEKNLKVFKNDNALKNASISFVVFNLNENKTICSYNQNMSLIPASTQKLITTATALEILSPDYRFVTKLQYDGFINSEEQTLYGNLYIKGGGDPTLGSDYFDPKKDFLDKWEEAVKKLGIKKIKGYIIADAQIFSQELVEPSWLIEDAGNYYASGASGLSIADNKYNVYFKTGTKHNQKTTITKVRPNIPQMKLDNRVKTSNVNKDMAYISGLPYQNKRIITGTLPKNRTDFIVKGSIPDPPNMVANMLNYRLLKNGIKVQKGYTTIRKLKIEKKINLNNKKRTTFCRYYSPELSKIVYFTNQKSVNLFAEHLVKIIALKQKKEGTTKKGIEAIIEFWKAKGVDVSAIFMADGSGLSRMNYISAKAMTQIMLYMRNKSKYFNSFYNSLPQAAKSGTLKYFGKNTKLAYNLRAKTGSMKGIKSLSGYMKNSRNQTLIISIIVNNYRGTNYEIMKKIQKLLTF